MSTEPTLDSELARALVRAARTFNDATVGEGSGPLPSEMHEAIGICLRVALALDPCAFASGIPTGALRAPAPEPEPPAKGKAKAKAAKPAAGASRQRAARGLPPCEKGGRHRWNKEGWCEKCGNVHMSGKTQTEIPGAGAQSAGELADTEASP